MICWNVIQKSFYFVFNIFILIHYKFLPYYIFQFFSINSIKQILSRISETFNTTRTYVFNVLTLAHLYIMKKYFEFRTYIKLFFFIKFEIGTYLYFFATDLLCAKKEIRSRVNPPCNTPRRDADVGLVRCQVHTWRPFYVLRTFEYFCSHHHVYLLYARCHGTSHEEIPLVEEIPHHLTNGELN